MLTSTQIEKIDRVFALIDSSGDGRSGGQIHEGRADDRLNCSCVSIFERRRIEQMAELFTAVARPDDGENRAAMREEFIEVMRTGVTKPENYSAPTSTSDVRRTRGRTGNPRRRVPAPGPQRRRQHQPRPVRTAIEEFHLSADPAAPGNWLLGSPSPAQ